MINVIMYDPELAQATLDALAKIMPEQSPHTSAEGMCSNGASPNDEVQCNPDPRAPHGFCRNASHNAGRYVCECEGWEPEDESWLSAGCLE